MHRALTFWVLFVLSLVIASASAGLPYLTNRNDVSLIMSIVLPLCLCWIVFVLIALIRFRWRGLWFFLGGPLTFWWPFWLAMIGYACAHNIRACP
jgi:membrane protein YdbS with pleckstrin-like domain